MSGDSVPMAMPLAGIATSECEAAILFRELRKPLIRYLVCLGLSIDDAQDVVQDAFLRLHRHLAAGGPHENIRGWLFRVAHNRARNCQNRQNRFDKHFGATLEQGIEPVSQGDTPERAMLQNERFHRLGEAMSLLTASERECLLLRAEGLRYREIGEVLGVPTSTVGDTVDRAIRKLAEKYNV